MDVTKSTTTPSQFLDHFANPWKAPGWLALTLLLLGVFGASVYWIFRLIRNRIPTVPPPAEGMTPGEANLTRQAYTSNPLRRIRRGVRRNHHRGMAQSNPLSQQTTTLGRNVLAQKDPQEHEKRQQEEQDRQQQDQQQQG